VSKLFHFLNAENRHEEGQALVEYSLILALVALAAITGVATMSGGIDGMYTTVREIATAMADSLGG
jgi:Flp pilus assembly pilin Flp